MSVRRWSGACLYCLAVMLVVGCASKQPKPVAVVVTHTMLSASTDVNPDSTGRASPVVVRFYQLRGDAEFAGADFFALFNKEKETLGASLIVVEEETMFPGQQMELKIPLSADARFVGAIAAFRDIQGAHWRAIIGAPEKSLMKSLATQSIFIKVGKDAITLSAEN
jgi:type VI secretion system protein VasD